MKRIHTRAGFSLALLPLAVIAATDTYAAPPAQANDNLTEIVVLSNRADLISAGDALVAIRVPSGTTASGSTISIGVVKANCGLNTPIQPSAIIPSQ